MGTISFANSGPASLDLTRTIGLAGGSLPRPSGPSRPEGSGMARRPLWLNTQDTFFLPRSLSGKVGFLGMLRRGNYEK